MPVTLATHAMGTRFELVLDGGDTPSLRAAGEAAIREIQECHQRFSLFEAGSWLNTINRRAAREAVVLDELTFELLETCQRVNEQSAGAFDVTVAPLMRAWGFHNDADPIDSDSIESIMNCVGMRHVTLDRDARTIRFSRPGVTLDLGGVAKGFAIDLAADVLHEYGINCALLHGGTSTVTAIGSPPGEKGWRVRLQTNGPDSPVVMLNDESLSVSAPHGRTIQSNGQTLGHVIDPRTGRPAECGPFAATIGQSACLTDAWATALLVLHQPPTTLPNNVRAVLPGDDQVTCRSQAELPENVSI